MTRSVASPSRNVGEQALAVCRGAHELHELMRERVLVADLQAGHPPVLHVRLIAVGHVDVAPSAHAPLVLVIEVLDSMQIVKIPGRGGMLAVDLERVERLVPARIPCRLERRERSVLEARQKCARIVDPHRLDLAREVVFALLDERLRHRAHFRDRTVQPHRRVDVVRQQIAGDAASRDRDVEPPQPFAALRQVARDRPVLQKLRAIVKDPSEPVLVDELPDHRHRGHEAVVVPDAVRHARLLDRGHHLRRFLRVSPERLLAHHHLAGLCGRDGDRVMRVVRAGDVDQIDVRARHQIAPVGVIRLVAPVLRERLDAFFVSRGHRLEHGLPRQVEEDRRLPERIRVRPPHEAVPDEADVESLHRSPTKNEQQRRIAPM